MMFPRTFLVSAGVLAALVTTARGRPLSAPGAGPATPVVASNVQTDYVKLGRLRLAVVQIPPGKFLMGTDQVIRADDSWKACASCAPRNDAERPVHLVTITRDFWMGQFDVTQGQWQELMGGKSRVLQARRPGCPGGTGQLA